MNLKTGESSARALARKFSARRVATESLTGQDLLPLYELLKKIPTSPGGLCREPLPFSGSSEAVNTPVLGLIVETRPHPALEFVVGQFAERLRIPIQLYHGTDNEAFILDSGIGSLVRRGQVQLVNMNISGLPARQYNALFLNPAFWESMACRDRVLVFQTDALLCPASPYTLDDFTDFDYIGSHWHPNRPVGLRIDGGSGGLSLRSWEKCRHCLEWFDPVLWPGGEDGYFAFHLDLIGCRVGNAESCARFSSQGQFADKSFGVHKPSLMKPDVLASFLEYCPEAEKILI